jgi:hypothetical protein
VQIFLTVLLGIVASLWILQAIRAALGMSRMPRLRDIPPLANPDCPFVSILFSARDEEKRLPRALATLLALDYPRYEIVAVNDRSIDSTGRLLDEAAARNPHLKVIHITELPPGWLGKPHGLRKAYEASSGEWLIFTDADVRFASDLLRRALALARQKDLAYLFLLGRFDATGFWEKTIVANAGMLLALLEPWQIGNPRSQRYGGAGYFQMLARSAYEAIGTHRRLAMEVMDDMKLAKLVKRSGVNSCVAVAGERIQVHWMEGLRGSIRNLEKNMFAGCEFRVLVVALAVVAILAANVLPLAALLFTSGWARALAGLATVAPMVMVAKFARRFPEMSLSPLFALTLPLGGLVLAYMLLNSTVKTLRRGGITWRGTFYPLEELRKGVV